jgi:hypothetical protein
VRAPRLTRAISKTVRHKGEINMNNISIDRLREQFEDEQLPQLLEKAKEKILQDFEDCYLKKRLEVAEQQIRNQFEEHELPELLEKMEEQFRDQFENELPPTKFEFDQTKAGRWLRGETP